MRAHDASLAFGNWRLELEGCKAGLCSNDCTQPCTAPLQTHVAQARNFSTTVLPNASIDQSRYSLTKTCHDAYILMRDSTCRLGAVPIQSTRSQGAINPTPACPPSSHQVTPSELLNIPRRYKQHIHMCFLRMGPPRTFTADSCQWQASVGTSKPL